MTDWTTKRYKKDYRNFTGIITERQPFTHELHMHFEVDDHGIIRTKRSAVSPDAPGTRYFEEYRYYTPEQAEAIAEKLMQSVAEARSRLTRAWFAVGNVDVNPS